MTTPKRNGPPGGVAKADRGNGALIDRTRNSHPELLSHASGLGSMTSSAVPNLGIAQMFDIGPAASPTERQIVIVTLRRQVIATAAPSVQRARRLTSSSVRAAPTATRPAATGPLAPPSIACRRAQACRRRPGRRPQ